MKTLITTYFLLFCLHFQVLSAPASINWKGQSQSLKGAFSVLEDKLGKKTLKDITNTPQSSWKDYPSDFLKFGYSNSYYWIKFDVNATPEQQNTLYWWFESDIPQEVMFFQVVDGSVVKKVHTGTNHTFITRDVQTRNLVFSFKTRRSSKSTIYARIHNDVGSMFCKTFLHSAEAFATIEVRETRHWSFFFAFMLFSAFFSLGLFVVFKEKIYVLYAFYLIFTALMIISINGFGNEWLWPNSTLMANISQVIWTFGSSGCLMGFIQYLLADIIGDQKLLKKLVKVEIGLLIFSVFLTIGFRQMPIDYVPAFLFFGNAVILFGVVLMAWMLFLGIYRRYSPTYYFFIAFFPVLGIGVAYYSRNLGLINWKVLDSPFAIIPPFIFEFVLLFVALLMRFRRYSRIQQEKQQLEMESQKRLQDERERISRDLHDNMGAQLSHIVRSAEWFSKHGNVESGTEQEVLSNMTETAKGAISTLRESIWTLNREVIQINDFIERYKKWALPLTKSSPQTTVVFNEKITTNSTTLKAEQSLQLFRILQEALNNSLKYAEATNIQIDFVLTENDVFEVKIQDNGTGFDVEEALEMGNGLTNMQQRAQLIGAKMKLMSEKSKGTQVQLIILL